MADRGDRRPGRPRLVARDARGDAAPRRRSVRPDDPARARRAAVPRRGARDQQHRPRASRRGGHDAGRRPLRADQPRTHAVAGAGAGAVPRRAVLGLPVERVPHDPPRLPPTGPPRRRGRRRPGAYRARPAGPRGALMAVVLGINAVFHDPAAAVVVDGRIVACAEEERFSRRKHGKESVPFSTWELPSEAARWCLAEAGVDPEDVDAVGYSYDPDLAAPTSSVMAAEWEGLRTLYARRAPRFLSTALPGLDPARVRSVAHHVAHAASAYLASPHAASAVMVLDGRGERSSYLAGAADGTRFRPLVRQALPHSLGLLYEDLTEHLGFHRSSDEYKVMALASYGKPRHLDDFTELVRTTADGGFVTERVSWEAYAPRARPGELAEEHADLAATVQRRLEQVVVELGRWAHEHTGERFLTMAGGTALNCVANAVLHREGPFEDVWVQPAAGDAGTALGAALHVAREQDELGPPMRSAALGRGFDDDQLERVLVKARVPHERPANLAAAVADELARNRVVAWFQ